MTHTTTTTPQAAEVAAALDRLREIGACWQAITDLLAFEPTDLSIDRQPLAALARMLAAERHAGTRDESAECRLERLRCCLSAMSGLLDEDELCGETRDQLATLGLFIAGEQAAALRALDMALAKGQIEAATAIAQHVTGQGRAQSCPIFSAAVVLAALRTHDIAGAHTADLNQLLMKCQATANLLRLEIEDRAADRQSAQTTRQGRGAS